LTIIWLKKPLPAALLLVLFWTVCRLGVLWHTGIPQPREHDEFSYLLQADIFAHGHLAMPPHPLGKFFESPHILVRPVYASKYPPGQALFLALGQRLLGSPFYGVIIGNALMLFTFCLMLYAWVPPPWPLAVSAMFGLILWLGSGLVPWSGSGLVPWSGSFYWANSYWGGSLAASGGALVLLGIGIFRARQAPLAGVVFAFGVLLLFWTRPYEGGVFTLMVLIVFARELWNKRRASVFAAALAVLAIGCAWSCYDNQAITGSPFRLPYVMHQRQYDVVPAFWFLPLRPEPTYSHPRLAAMLGTNGWAATAYEENRPRRQLFGTGLIHSLGTVKISLRPAILLMLLVPAAWRDPFYRKMAIVSGVFLLALSVETWHLEHYTAPVWAALALMIAVWAERAWNLRIRKQRVGAALVLLALTSPATAFIYYAVRLHQQISVQPIGDSSAMNVANWPERRGALIERLSKFDRRQLVIVRYPSPSWDIHHEWVYNGADIDRQRVVFAHDLGTEQDRTLLDYYPDRTALLLTFDSVSGQEHIEPYPPAPSQE
jgi:hypothetical protein